MTAAQTSEQHAQQLSDAAIAWQREHTEHPHWCEDHEYGDGSSSGVHQSRIYKVRGGLQVDLYACDEDEARVRIMTGADDISVPLASVAALTAALSGAAELEARLDGA